jgi:hypothetical protein
MACQQCSGAGKGRTRVLMAAAGLAAAVTVMALRARGVSRETRRPS